MLEQNWSATYTYNPEIEWKIPPLIETDPDTRANLLRLRDGLLLVEDEYFDMQDWNFGGIRAQGVTRDQDGHAVRNPDAHECGTVACAGGWGPILGIGLENIQFTPVGKMQYIPYINETFGGHSSVVFNWVFSEYWVNCDNTPFGAAARIDLLLHKGVPTEFMDTTLDCEPQEVEQYLVNLPELYSTEPGIGGDDGTWPMITIGQVVRKDVMSQEGNYTPATRQESKRC